MPRILALLLASALLLDLSACSATGATGPSDWDPVGHVMGFWHAPDRTVAVTLSDVVRNGHGTLVRVLSISNVFATGSDDGPSQGLHEVRAAESYKVGVSVNGRRTLFQPREGLTWGDVRTAEDLVLETESG